MNVKVVAFLVVLFVGYSVGLYHKAFNNGELHERDVWRDAKERFVEDQAKRRQEVENELLETETAWLEEKENTRIEYRDKVRTVYKTVTKYIDSGHTVKCGVGSDGMQQINEALRGATGKGKDADNRNAKMQ